MKRIDSLRDDGGSLTEYVAIAANKRAEMKAQLLSEKQMAKENKGKELTEKDSVATA